MHAVQQHTVAAVPYAYDPNVLQPRHIEIVDATNIPATSESFVDGIGETVESREQVVYPSSIVSEMASTQHHEYIDEDAANVLYSQTQPGLIPEEDAQNELNIDPIDLEEVQKIQARMPAADPNAPVGSTKNPIRIIQQGNQYITTQDVSDEHLQQIIQVLTNQALISSSGSRPNAIYNRLTNRRIIFRVTRAKRRHNAVGGRVSYGLDRTKPLTRGRGRGRGRGTPGRKRRKRGSDEEDPDFEPELPEEEVLPFPLARRTSASGRISKPPRHLIKDYKHLRLEDLTTKPESSDGDEHSDGGYSDYINDGLSEGALSEDGSAKTPRFPCSVCDKVFSSRAGVARHRSVAHGPNDGKARFRQVNPYVASMKRRAKLKEAVAAATDDELVEFAAPRLSKLLNPWDHLLFRSEDGDPPLPQVPRIVLDYLSLVERARSFLRDHLQLRSASSKVDESGITKKSTGLHDSETLKDDTPTVTSLGTDSVSATNFPTEASHQQSDPTRGYESGATEMHFTDYNDNETTIKDATSSESFEDKEADDDDDGKIVIKIETPDQSTALDLPCGTYTVAHPLREDYLPRRFRSVLAAQQAAASAPNDESYQESQKHALIAVETADDDAVDATLRTDSKPVDDESVPAMTDLQSQHLLTLGDELFLVPEGGLGGPVPDEWLASGAFLAVLTETGETSDLVMEAATGRLFHRPTGHLVSLADTSNVPTQSDAIYEEPVAVSDFGAYEDEEPTVQPSEIQPEVVEENASVVNKSPSSSRPRPKTRQEQQLQHQQQMDDAEAQREELLQRIAESGEVIDLNALFPGVSVTEVSPGVCLVTKPNGDRFNVEHGGDGITLETLQTILQMDSEPWNEQL